MGAWCVGLIADDNYVAVGSQRVAQGGIDNFDACVRLVVGDAILGVLNKGGLRFYLLFGDEYNLSAPRSGAPGGGAGGGTPPPQRFFGFERARR